MPELNFTPEQRAAIDTRGSTVLVSAAAGSGKTRVLTERLMAYLTDAEHPVDIDHFLVITYTRAAAAELRSRILDGIYARIASDPENRRLRRQVALCARAEIGTIHSFCADFLRANCAALALAPDFQVADTERCAALRAAALEHTLERAYTRLDTDAPFRLLADTVGGGRDDARLGELVLSLYAVPRTARAVGAAASGPARARRRDRRRRYPVGAGVAGARARERGALGRRAR